MAYNSGILPSQEQFFASFGLNFVCWYFQAKGINDKQNFCCNCQPIIQAEVSIWASQNDDHKQYVGLLALSPIYMFSLYDLNGGLLVSVCMCVYVPR